MGTQPTLRLGTRGSDLALWQARRIAGRVEHELGVACEIVVIRTQGDKIQHVAFHKMEGKGFFTKELQEALLEHRIDLVVHSLKDLPTEEPAGLAVVALPERERSADLLLARPGVLDPSLDGLGLPANAVVGTSSLRRAAQVLATNPAVRITALRGNVPTRIEKLRHGAYDAILIAAAGVGRLGLDLSDLAAHELGPDAMLPAPGQGALAVETRAGDPATAVLERLHDPAIARLVAAERALLGLLGGGCHLPLGCLAADDPEGIVLDAVLGEVDEEITTARVARTRAVAADPATVAARCADDLRRMLPGAARK